MRMLNAALVSSDQPSFEQRGHEGDARHDFVSRIGAIAYDADVAPITSRRQPSVWIIAPGTTTSRTNVIRVSADTSSMRRRRIRPNSAPALFGRHSDDRLGFGSPPTFTLFRAADIGFVDFDLATEIVSSWTHHRAPQLVQPSPGGLIATKPQFPLEPERTDSVLLAGDEPHRQKPQPQRLACVLEHRASRQSCFRLAGATPEPVSRHGPRLTSRAAFRAHKSIRPPQAPDIVATGGIGAEPLVHFVKGPGIIGSGNGMNGAFHRRMVAPGMAGVKGIPILSNCVILRLGTGQKN